MANPTPLINLGPGGVTRHASHLPPFYFPLGVPDVVTAPVAAFSGDVLAGSEPLAVTFADESLNTPTGWLWDFGDGSTSTSQNPTHTYTAAGTYDVTLTATNGAGSDALTQTNYVDVTPALPVGVTLAAAYAAHPDHCWQDAGRSVPCGDGDLVYTWDDLTGNSRHLVQATAKYRPRLVRLSDGTWAVAFDGLPTVPGLDTGDRLAAAFPLAQPFTRAAALQFRDLARTAFQMPLDGATASTAYYYRRPAPDQSTIRVHAGADVSSSPVAGDVDRTVQVYAGAATAVYRDGTLVLSGDAGTAAPGGVAVGRSADGNYPAAVSVARLGVLAAAADSDQRAALRAWLDRFDPPALPAAYVPAATAGDGLLLAGSTSGLALSATPPTKDGTNPVLDPLPLTGSPPDHDKLWLRALEDGAGGVRLWLGVIDGTAASDRTGWTYQTSADGRTGWVKPNLGQVTIGGNTNNNFVNARPSYFTGLDHAPGLGAGPAWLGCDEIWDAGGTVYGARLLYSDDGLAWTVGRVIATMSADGVESGCPVRRADGRWSVYALQHDTVTGRRNVVRYDSYTADCRGGWVGPFAVPAWTAASDSRQFYRSVVRRTRGGWLALVSLYDLATQRMWVEPYASGDEGATWTQLHDSTWLPRGASGAWDEVVHISADTVTLGTGEHVVYFTGGSQPHDQPLMLSQVGVASVPAGRMVRLTGTGTHTTPAGATAGLACRVDADGTGGSVTAAVLNAGGSVISGYDDTDMTAITGAASDQLLSWGGTSALPAGADKVRFTLTSATLYGWRVA